jgi:hypothetical protein
METTSQMLSRVEMPTLRGDCLWVLSDYSFENPASDFDTVALLVTAPNTLGFWNDLRIEVRKVFLRDGRSVCWKKLNSDTRRNAAFLPFLRAANQIRGLSIAFAFHRSSEFQVPADGLEKLQESLQLSLDWKPRRFKQMFRIAYCTAMMVAGLSSSGQHIHWVSDHDASFANNALETDTMRVFMMLLNTFLPHQLGQIYYGTTASGVEPDFQEDLAAIPDLMCGASCEIFTSIKREYTDIPLIYSRLPRLERRAQEYWQWYANGQWPLKRYICAFESRDRRNPAVKILDPKNIVSRLHIAN